MNKYLEQKVEILPDERENGLKSAIELEYYLVEDINSDGEELKGMQVFGIELIKKTSTNIIEGQLIRNFSCSKEKTVDLINKLAKNSVTPSALDYVIDDMLGAWEQ